MHKPIDAPPWRWFFGNAEQRGLAWRYWVSESAHGLGHMAIYYATRALPIDTVSALGNFVGRKFGRRAYPEADRRARENWARLRSNDAAQAEAITDYAFGQTGRVHWEFAIVDRLLQGDRLTIDGAEHLRAAQAAGRPILVACLHLSNWEVIGIALTLSGQRVSSIYQPPPNRFDHRIAVNSRRRWGWIPTPSGPSGARLAYRRLVERQCAMGIYIDECIDEHVYAPFFGRKLKLEGNIALVARLATMTGAAVIPAYVVRGDGAHFHATFMPPIDLVSGGDRDAELVQNVTRINATVEPVIRKHLDQWFWLFDLRLDP